MNNLKQWVIQIRYPYTAGTIAVMWLGSAILAMIRPEISVEVLVGMVAVATLIVASVGFSSGRK